MYGREGISAEFRCPSRNRMLADYGEFVGQAVTSRLVEFRRATKEFNKGRLLTAAPFG